MEPRVWHRFYDDGVPASLDFEDLPLPRFLERSARDHPDAIALIFLNRRLTYRELQNHVNRFATALSALDVGSGSRVAIQLPNLPQSVVAFYAVLSLGATAVMTNPLYVEREIEHQWNDAGCEVAITTDFLFARRLSPIRDRLRVKHYVIASIPDYLRFPLNLLASWRLRRANPPLVASVSTGPGVHFMRHLLKATAPHPPRVRIAMDDLAALQYTGGTTGVTKGAMLTHRNLSANVQQVAAWFAKSKPGSEVMLGCLPFFHVFGLTVAMNFAIKAAAAIVLMPDPRDIPRMVSNIAKHRVTLFPGVPTMFNAIVNASANTRLDLTSVTSCFSGAAPLPPQVLERFEALTDSKIVEGYGLTEASPVTHVNPLNGLRKIGSIGIPCPSTDMKIVSLDDGATEVPPGKQGELLVAGPQVMSGYWKAPDASAAVLTDDGWLRTGDVATVDEDGYCFIVGRKKDMIIAGGYNIYPDEVDSVLMAHPAVHEAATIGVPDSTRGETVKSFVVLREGHAATADDLIEHCRRELAAYKRPRSIEFIDELPKSSALKILRRELRDREVAAQARRSPIKEG
jgi:long-chain acyl-CoA synthetase